MLSNTAWMILFTTLLSYSILLFPPFFNPFIQTTEGEIPFGFISHVNDRSKYTEMNAKLCMLIES